MSIDSGADLLMILLYSPGQSDEAGEAIRGITRLQKLVFLLLKEGNLEDTLSGEMEFEAYDYGPYSSSVLSVLETLKGVGLIQVKEAKLESYREVVDGIAASFAEDEGMERPKIVEVYGLSDKGMRIGEELYGSLPEVLKASIQQIKKKYNPMKLMALLKYVYTQYPEMRERSRITDTILGYGKRPELTTYERDE